MRKFLIVTLALMLVLGLSGVALAHSATITQGMADFNFVFVGQYDDGLCLTDVDQDGWFLNSAVVVQRAPDCVFEIAQGDSELLNFVFLEQSDADALTDWLTIEEKVEELADMFYYFVLERDVEWPGFTPGPVGP